MPVEDLPAGVGARRDYTAEGQRLLRSLGVDAGKGGHHDLDVIWRHPSSGGCIFVGNDTAARGPAATLLAQGITHIVNATDDLANYLEGAPELSYLRFNVADWQTAGDRQAEHLSSRDVQLAFVQRLFDFVDQATLSGGSVLVHCLAGAHRAGTTGALLLMHKAGHSVGEATRAAKAARPIINPIGGLPKLLSMYEQARDEQRTARSQQESATAEGLERS